MLLIVVLVLIGVLIFEKVVVLVVIVLDTLRTLEVVVRKVIQEYRRLSES
jgi:hypothetical protein